MPALEDVITKPSRKRTTVLQKRHNTYAKSIVKNKGDLVKAYQNTYPNATLETAQQRCKLIIRENPKIIHDVAKLMDKQGLSVPVCNERLKDIIDGQVSKDYASTVLEGLKTAYKLHGKLQTGTNISIDNREQSINVDSHGNDNPEKLTHTLSQFKSLNVSLNGIDSQEIGEIDAEDAQFVEVDHNI